MDVKVFFYFYLVKESEIILEPVAEAIPRSAHRSECYMPSQPPTDDELLALLQRAPEQGIDLLFRKHYAWLCQRIIRLVKEPALAEDLAQDVFLELWKKREQLRIQASIPAYLARAGRNKALNYLRDHRMDQQREELTDERWLVEAQAVAQLQARDLQDRVDALLDSLPDRCRLVFVLSRFEDLSNREIAQQLGIAEKTVENQMNKALRLMRAGLDSYFS